MNDVREKKKLKKRTYIIASVIGVLLLAICIFSFFVPPASWKYYVDLPSVSARKEGELRIHFLSAGQGDCTVIELPDGKSLMIDGSTEDFTSTALRYLNALKIKKLDYLLLTHTDSDHSGGLDKVVKYKGADKVYLPDVTDYSINDEYAELYAEVLKSDAEIVLSHRYVEFNEDENAAYNLMILAPLSAGNDSTYDVVNDGSRYAYDINDTSAVVWLEYSGVSALFMGDATSRVESVLIEHSELGFFDSRGVDLTQTDILKVGHHGSSTSTSEEFVQYLGLKTAVVSCGKDNRYGHPTETVCDNLTSVGAEIYRTDLQGNIVVTISSDGTYRTEFEYISS